MLAYLEEPMKNNNTNTKKNCRGLFILRQTLAGLLFFLLFVPVDQGMAAPKPDLWPVWEKHDPQSVLKVDYRPWAMFLKKYLVVDAAGVNLVDYGAVTAVDRTLLADFIQEMAETPVSRLRREEQKAYWINLYNALTLKVILDHYPVDSIRDIDISPGFFSDGPWGKKLLSIEGREVSLNDIEHRILRPVFKDNRIHYALNCASIGCPQLQPVPFTAQNMNALLNQAGREFVNDPRGVKIESGRLIVSSIYTWFEQDFGKNEQEVITHVRSFADKGLDRQLENFDSIDRDQYDWNLNRSR